MPSEVAKSFAKASIANLFSELAPARQGEKRDETVEAEQGRKDKPVPFGQLVAAERRQNEPRRPENGQRRNERLMPGQIGRQARAEAQSQRAALRNDGADAQIGAGDPQPARVAAPEKERPACERHASAASDPAEAKTDKRSECDPGVSAETHAGIAQKPETSTETSGGNEPACFAHAAPSEEALLPGGVIENSGETPMLLVGALRNVAEGEGQAIKTPTEGEVLLAGGGTAAVVVAGAEIAKRAFKASSDLGQGGSAEITVTDETGSGEEAATEARSPVADKAAELKLARAEGDKSGIGEELSAFAKEINGKPGEAAGNGSAKEAKPAQPDLHPVRATPLRELLEGFTHPSAIHRPADILAGLDRSVAAAALNNRGHEIQRPTPLQMLPIEIGMQAVRGVTSFQIRLDPAELGRVDVDLRIRDNGEVHANLVVDRVETLAMLKRDASTLQYAFEQAGLRQSADGLTFSLRGENQQGQQQGGEHRSQGHDAHEEAELHAQVGEIAMRRALIPNSSVDLMV